MSTEKELLKGPDPLAYDIPGMRRIDWQRAMAAPQAILQLRQPDELQLQQLSERFGLHDLHQVDIRNPDHPARLFKLPRATLLILRLPYFEEMRLRITSVCLLFDERLCTIIVPDRMPEYLDKRLVAGSNLTDVICRAIHALVDHLFRCLTPQLEYADDLEDASFARIETADMEALLEVRQNLAILARAAHGNYTALDPLMGNSAYAGNHHINDALEHMQRSFQRAESRSEHILAVMQAIQSLLGQRMNETVKVLTIITVILTPLAVITGIFGMNFEHMDILHRPWGFGATLLAMLVIVVALGMLFKWKRWW